ncbi:MAG: GntR family transcriptional regulator [Chloroflexi bacterium]|nr:GntR family transcriptional regulator [Chloroflexota bacterium]
MRDQKPSIEFHLDNRSGVPPYLQLVHQVKQALRLGFLVPGDQLPTMRMVVSQVVINPNTVFKAYRELEMEGLVVSRPGQGTFVVRTLADDSLDQHDALRASLQKWIDEAFEAGLSEESVTALFVNTLQMMIKEIQK